MTGLIYEITEGPENQPNGRCKARIVRRSDTVGFFVVETATGETRIVHELKIKLRWADNSAAETAVNPS